MITIGVMGTSYELAAFKHQDVNRIHNFEAVEHDGKIHSAKGS